LINKKKKWACLADLRDYLVREQKEEVIDFNGWRLEMEDAIYLMKYGELEIIPKEIVPKETKKKGKKNVADKNK
jgi:hypothetical protein